MVKIILGILEEDRSMHRDQQPLPLSPENSKQIGDTCFFIIIQDDTNYYYVYHQYIGRHAPGRQEVLELHRRDTRP